MPQSQVSAIMHTGRRQRRVTGLDVLGRIADGLAMPDDARARLGLAPHEFDRGRPDVQMPAGSAEVGDVDPEPWTLAEALTRSSISPQIMDRFERVALAQVARYPSAPPAEMWPAVRRELGRTQRALMERQSLHVQRRLVKVVGVLAGVAGNLSVDLGQRAQAYEYFCSATRPAPGSSSHRPSSDDRSPTPRGVPC